MASSHATVVPYSVNIDRIFARIRVYLEVDGSPDIYTDICGETLYRQISGAVNIPFARRTAGLTILSLNGIGWVGATAVS